MMGKALLTIFFVILISIHIVSLRNISDEVKLIPKGEDTVYIMPPAILRITSLEFRGLASDFLFLKALVFIGSTLERTESPKVKAWEWKWIYNTLEASTVLDPYFLDPYYLGNANLTWGAGMIREANTLLEKGTSYRKWDHLLPFYEGFNYFYFLGENQKASEALMEAARRNNASPLYGDLAVKLGYKEKRTENAILFQDYILQHTDDPLLQKEYKTRLKALQGIRVLEKAVDGYRKKIGREPVNLDDLIRMHILAELPKEPYGGTYYIDAHGEIKTTSESHLMPYQH